MGKLGRELFKLVQESQGYAFIADDVEDMPDEEVIRIARASLRHTRITAEILEEFLKRNTQSKKKRRG